jgi:hypothetical protein
MLVAAMCATGAEGHFNPERIDNMGHHANLHFDGQVF